MAKKGWGKLVALAAVSGAVAAGVSYVLQYLSVFCLNILVFYGKTKAAVPKALQYSIKIPNRL